MNPPATCITISALLCVMTHLLVPAHDGGDNDYTCFWGLVMFSLSK